MLFSKRNIYNKALKCIASDILIDVKPEEVINDSLSLLIDFIEIVNNEADKSERQFHVIIDEQYEKNLDTLAPEFKDTLCYRCSPQQITTLQSNNIPLSIELTSTDDLDHLNDKVKFLLIPYSEFNALADHIDDIGSKTNVVVTGVNDYAMLDQLQARGVNYFSGEFIEKPRQINQATIPANKISVLKLISSLNQPNTEVDDISKIIVADNILSYKLLRIVNSPIFRGVNELNSIQDAIIRFGYGNLKKWALMLSLCSVSDKPKALIKLALERAIMCENLAKHLSYDKTETYYTAGLLSTLDAFLEYPMTELLRDTALVDDIKLAILNKEGPIGEALHTVISYQHGDNRLSSEVMTEIYMKSAQEAKQLFESIGMD